MRTPRLPGQTPLALIALLALAGCGEPARAVQPGAQPPALSLAPIAPPPLGLAPEATPLGRLPADVRPTRYAVGLSIESGAPALRGGGRHRRRARPAARRDLAARPGPRGLARDRGAGGVAAAAGALGAGLAERRRADRARERRGAGAGHDPRRVRRPVRRPPSRGSTSSSGAASGTPSPSSRPPTRAASSPASTSPGFKTPFDLTLRVPRGPIAIANTRETARAAEGEGARGWERVALRADGAAADVPRRVRRRAARRGHAPPLAAERGARAPAPAPRRRREGARAGARVRARAHGRRSSTRWRRYFGIAYPYDKLDLVAVPDDERRDGEPGRDHLPRAAPAPRPEDRARRAALRGGDDPRARARAPVVRRPRHHGLVGRHLAQRGVRDLDGAADRLASRRPSSPPACASSSRCTTPWAPTPSRAPARSASRSPPTTTSRTPSTPSPTTRAAPCSRCSSAGSARTPSAGASSATSPPTATAPRRAPTSTPRSEPRPAATWPRPSAASSTSRACPSSRRASPAPRRPAGPPPSSSSASRATSRSDRRATPAPSSRSPSAPATPTAPRSAGRAPC